MVKIKLNKQNKNQICNSSKALNQGKLETPNPVLIFNNDDTWGIINRRLFKTFNRK